jgi:hypothetical protein
MQKHYVSFFIEGRQLTVYRKRYLVLGGLSRIKVLKVTHEQEDLIPYKYFAITLDDTVICIVGGKQTALDIARRAKKFIKTFVNGSDRIPMRVLSGYGDRNRRLIAVLNKHY